MKVEFRLLQLMLNTTGGDRRTVGVVHWDGHELRSRFAADRIPSDVGSARDEWRAVVDSIARDAKAKPRESLDLGLKHVFPVREGAGGAVVWTAIRAGETKHPAAHFEALVDELRLRVEPGRAHVTERQVREELRQLGQSLAERCGERIATDRSVSKEHDYESPLSWRNGVWHHAIPVILDVASASELIERACNTIGRVETSLPDGEVPVIVAVLPSDGALVEKARREIDILVAQLSKRTGRAFAEIADTTGPDGYSALRARVIRDVETKHD